MHNLEDKSNFKKVGFFVCIGSFPLHDHTLYFSKKFRGFPRQKWKTSHILPVTLHISGHIQSEHTFTRPTERFLTLRRCTRRQLWRDIKSFFFLKVFICIGSSHFVFTHCIFPRRWKGKGLQWQNQNMSFQSLSVWTHRNTSDWKVYGVNWLNIGTSQLIMSAEIRF